MIEQEDICVVSSVIGVSNTYIIRIISDLTVTVECLVDSAILNTLIQSDYCYLIQFDNSL